MALGSAHPNIAPYQAVKAQDGYFVLACGNDGLWEKMVEVCPIPFGHDREYRTNPDRVVHREELIRRLEEEVFAAKSVIQWVDILRSVGVPAAPIQSFSEVFRDPQVKAREMVQVLHHPIAGDIQVLGIPVKLSNTPGVVALPPPTLDQHRKEILARFGITESS